LAIAQPMRKPLMEMFSPSKYKHGPPIRIGTASFPQEVGQCGSRSSSRFNQTSLVNTLEGDPFEIVSAEAQPIWALLFELARLWMHRREEPLRVVTAR
jgi:hypothetical protein